MLDIQTGESAAVWTLVASHLSTGLSRRFGFGTLLSPCA
jgi:hypothetical protein